MPGDVYPKFRAAAVQAAPVFLDRDTTIDKLDGLVQKAANAGADLIVFGESFIPAFPVWNLIYAPMGQHGFFRRLFDNAVEVPGAHKEAQRDRQTPQSDPVGRYHRKGFDQHGSALEHEPAFRSRRYIAKPPSQARPHVG